MKISEIEAKIKKYGLLPTSQRELSLFSSSCVAKGYVDEMYSIIGFSQKAVCFFYSQPWAHYLFNEHYVADKTTKFLEKNKSSLGLIFKKLEYLKTKTNSATRAAKTEEKKDLINSLKKIVDIYPEYMGGMGVYNCFWRYLKFPEGKVLLNKKEIDIISKKREECAKVYPKVEITLKKIVNKIGKKEKFDGDLLLSLSLFEMKKYLAGRLDVNKILKELKKRWGHSFYYYSNTGEEEIISDKKIVEKLSKDLREIKEKKITKLSGQIGYGGKVSGVVYNLIKTKTRAPKKDFVLVTSMTHPKDIMLLKKASAIVTDEGGILCHAAIVARELKKPCVIGTKIATQVLKDGDLVEVDAVAGIVKKL